MLASWFAFEIPPTSCRVHPTFDASEQDPKQSIKSTRSRQVESVSDLPPVSSSATQYDSGQPPQTFLTPDFFCSPVFNCLDPSQQQGLMQYLIGLNSLSQMYASSLLRPDPSTSRLLHPSGVNPSLAAMMCRPDFAHFSLPMGLLGNFPVDNLPSS